MVEDPVDTVVFAMDHVDDARRNTGLVSQVNKHHGSSRHAL